MKFLNCSHSASSGPVDIPFLKYLLSRKIDILSTFCNSHFQCVKWGEIISPPSEHHRSQLRQQVAVCSVSAWDIARHHEYSVTLSKARSTLKNSFLWKFLSWALCTQQRDALCSCKFQLTCSAFPPKEGSLLVVHLTALSTGLNVQRAWHIVIAEYILVLLSVFIILRLISHSYLCPALLRSTGVSDLQKLTKAWKNKTCRAWSWEKTHVVNCPLISVSL